MSDTGVVPFALAGGLQDDTTIWPWIAGFGCQAGYVLGFIAQQQGWWRSTKTQTGGFHMANETDGTYSAHQPNADHSYRKQQSMSVRLRLRPCPTNSIVSTRNSAKRA